MRDLIVMWKSPKMIALTMLTAVLYPLLIYPFQQYTFFGQASFFRLGIGVPVAFSFLFGPAAAWGAAIGNLFYDAATSSLSFASIFGFIGNFLVGYIPYKLWTAITDQKPDLRSIKKLGLFVSVTAIACIACGLIIGWALLALFSLPFVMMAFTIAATDMLWGVTVGALLLGLCYGAISRRKLLYTDNLKDRTPAKAPWNKSSKLLLLTSIIAMLLSFLLPAVVPMSSWMLLPFVIVSIAAVLAACR